LLGAAGSGKSDLLLRLIDRGWSLVADDQVVVEQGLARAPAALAGLLEIRGVGLFRRPVVEFARLRLVVRLGGAVDRLPGLAVHAGLGLPELMIEPFQASAPVKIEWALDAALGKAGHVVGAFAA
jgi:HPr kinase/phosphorylase